MKKNKEIEELPKALQKDEKATVKKQTGKKVLISSQPEVLKEVSHRELAFITVTPSNNLKDEYIERYKRRGNNQNFIELMSKNFDTFSGDLAKNSKATANIIVRKENTYLSDIL